MSASRPLLVTLSFVLIFSITGIGVSQTSSSGVPSPSDLPSVIAAYDQSEATLQNDQKLTKRKPSAVAKYLSDNITVTFKPEFSNTFPNLLGNPVVSTDHFTWKGQVFGAQYEFGLKDLPLSKSAKNNGFVKYFLNFTAIGISGGVSPKANLVVNQLVLQNAFQGTAAAYFQVKFTGKDIRQARENAAALTKKVEDDTTARDEALHALVTALEKRVATLESERRAN